MLLQFSAISLLLLMWSRAMNVSAAIDKKAFSRLYRSSKSLGQSHGSIPTPPGPAADDVAMMRHSLSAVIDVHKNDSNLDHRPTVSGSSSGNIDLRSHLVQKRIACILINVIAWLVILGTILVDKQSVYDVNIIALSVLCFVLSISMLVIGMMNWLRLRKELSTVYTSGGIEGSGVTRKGTAKGRNVSAGSNSSGSLLDQFSSAIRRSFVGGGKENDRSISNTTDGSMESQSRPGEIVELMCCYCGSGGMCCGAIEAMADMWSMLFSAGRIAVGGGMRLRIQTEVIRTVLLVSLIVALFFALRCYAFMYRPLLENEFDVRNAWLSAYYYPWLFYQLPELIPNLVVARGISPPKGLLRQTGKHMYAILMWVSGLLAIFDRCHKQAARQSDKGCHNDDKSGGDSTGGSFVGRATHVLEDEGFGYDPDRMRSDSESSRVSFDNPVLAGNYGGASRSQNTGFGGRPSTATERVPQQVLPEIAEDMSNYIYTISSYSSALAIPGHARERSEDAMEMPEAGQKENRFMDDEDIIASLDLY